MDYPIDQNLHLPTCVNVVDSRVWTQMKRATQMLGTLPGTGLHLEKAANELAAEGEGGSLCFSVVSTLQMYVFILIFGLV